jgi:hypothetical protein
MWVIHDPKSCTLQHEKKKKKRVTIQPGEEESKPNGRPKGLKVNPALQSIMEEEQRDSNDMDMDDE